MSKISDSVNFFLFVTRSAAPNTHANHWPRGMAGVIPRRRYRIPSLVRTRTSVLEPRHIMGWVSAFVAELGDSTCSQLSPAALLHH